MSVFTELVAAVQVGTGKIDPPRSAHLDGYRSDSPERTALIELGALDLMRRAGTMGTSIDPYPASPPETRPVAHAAPLEEAFEAHERVVMEWLAAAAQAGFVAPSSALPRLLAMARRHRALIRPVLGERGRWLAGIMGVEIGEEPPEADIARASLRDEYDALSPEDRARKVEAMGRDPLPGDEPLLTRALADRRREVRDAALDPLLRLSGSAMARELQAIAEPVLGVKKTFLGRSLTVAPPDPAALPKWLPRTPPCSWMGPAALAVRDIARFVPPSVWSRATEMPPNELLDRSAKTEFALALYEGWQEAALRFDDQEWIDAVFSIPRPEGARFDMNLVPRVSEARFDAAMTERMKRDEIYLLSFRHRPLSPNLSRAVVATTASSSSNPHYSLAELAFVLDPSVLPLLEAPGRTENVESLRAHWRKILKLRARLLQSLR